MSSVLYVTTKDFCKRAWFGALLAVGMLVMGPLFFVVLTRLQGLNLDGMEHDLTGYHFAYLGLSWVAFLAVSLQALSGSQKICLGLPVSSRAIASWLMFSMVGLVVVLQLLTNGVYRMLFFDDRWLAEYWPLLGPLLFLVTLILVGHSLFWSMHAPSFTRVLLGSVLILGMFYWFLSRYYPYGFKAALVPWSQVTLGEFVLMQLVCIAAWYQGTRAFAKVRAGTAVPSPVWERVEVWWNEFTTGAIPEPQPAALSRRSSLVKLHWRESCRRAVIIGGLLLSVLTLPPNLLIGLRIDPSQSNLTELAVGLLSSTTMFSFIAAVVVAVLLGDGMTSMGRTEMKGFLAMAPLTDRDLSVIFFRNMVKTFVWTFSLILGALLISLSITIAVNGSQIFERFLILLVPKLLNGEALGYVGLVLIGFWIIAANMISVFWTGHKWFVLTVMGVGFGGLIFYSITIGLLQILFRSSFPAAAINGGMLLTVYLLLLGGTMAAFVAARRKQLITNTKMVAVLSVSFVLTSVFLIILWKNNIDPLSSFIFVDTTLVALIVAPFATIPLALSWNRHR